MALIDKYGGKSIRVGLIAKYVGKKPKRGRNPSTQSELIK